MLTRLAEERGLRDVAMLGGRPARLPGSPWQPVAARRRHSAGDGERPDAGHGPAESGHTLPGAPAGHLLRLAVYRRGADVGRPPDQIGLHLRRHHQVAAVRADAGRRARRAGDQSAPAGGRPARSRHARRCGLWTESGLRSGNGWPAPVTVWHPASSWPGEHLITAPSPCPAPRPELAK